MKRFYVFIDIRQSDVADSTFCLAYRLDDGSCRGHTQDTVHIILVLQYTFLEKLIGTGRGFTRIGNDLHIGSAYFFPVLDLAGEDSFQLFAGQVVYLIGGMNDYRQGIISDHHLLCILLCFLQTDFFIEFHFTGRHRNIGRSFHESRDTDTRAATRYGHFSAFMLIHKILGLRLADGQTSITSFDLLCKYICCK